MPLNSQKRAIVLDDFKAIYVETPKVACSSIKVALGQAAGIPEQTVTGWQWGKLPLVDLLDPKYDDYLKFTFVRNPWDRVVSCYAEKFDNPQIDQREDLQNAYIRPLKYRLGVDEVNFDNYLKYISSFVDEASDPHWKSQFHFLLDEDCKLLVNYLGRFETLSQDFNEVAQHLGMQTTLPHTLKSPNREPDYRKHYTQEQQQRVAERFELDISMFRYEF